MTGQVANCARIQKPAARRLGIEHGFKRCKRFGSDDKQRGFGIDFIKNRFQIVSVHVRDEMNGQTFYMKMTQRLRRHSRTEVRSANTDVDDIGDLLAGKSLPFS